MMDDLLPVHWPECWRYDMRIVEVGGEPRRVLGDRTTMDAKGVLTYRCSCGQAFTRLPGFRIEEARAWVTEHAPHVEPKA